MNQPKFKFGDKVIGKENQFTVKGIAECEDGYFYSGVGEHGWRGCGYEHNLELYQEPQKKKLYAYRVSVVGEIKLYDHEKLGRFEDLKRAPDYDIDYSCIQQNCAKDQ
jgi:hypothetical protein